MITSNEGPIHGVHVGVTDEDGLTGLLRHLRLVDRRTAPGRNDRDRAPLRRYLRLRKALPGAEPVNEWPVFFETLLDEPLAVWEKSVFDSLWRELSFDVAASWGNWRTEP